MCIGCSHISSMFKKICIANRGEIAVRIIKTCRRLGIRTLAVYSEADRHAVFVGMADEAAYLGSAEARASYLDGAKLAALARQFGADAVHPGYGFLAENAAFAELCQDAGVVFIGPHIEAIRSMGSKIEAKRIAERAGVATVPGYHGEKQDDATLCVAAKELGFPVLIKPSAGGGGKGMRVVRDNAGVQEALVLARREALAAFGDDRLLLERYIEEPRHLEVQIAGDKHGNLIHLFERECSIQRRYQKLIEEAPAAFLSEAIRQELCADALRITGGIGYDSLGTVEFIYDNRTGQYYFLEMNTRLQVEHPVTEMITGIDLVELQIRVAAGEPLRLTQADITCNGWAIEARVNAENPAEEFLPETGTITLYEEPDTDGVRIDSGITRGSQVSPYYDSLLAKVIAYGDNRSAALQRLLAALDHYMIGGVSTNSGFLRDLLSLPAFSNEPLSTRFIDQHFPTGWTAGAHAGEIEQAAAVVVYALACEQQSRTDTPISPWRRLGSWRVIEQAGFPGETAITLSDGRTRHNLRLSGRWGRYRVSLDNRTVDVRAWQDHDGLLALEVDGALHHFATYFSGDTITISVGAQQHTFTVVPREETARRSEGMGGVGGVDLVAPMPGLITEVKVAVGDTVQEGDVLVVMEAMKMIHMLTAVGDGMVRAVHCRPGETVRGAALLVEIGEAHSSGD